MRRTGGFTLVEMVVVISLIGVVACMALYVGSGRTAESEKSLIRAELNEIATACKHFQFDMGEPPMCIAELLQSPTVDSDSTTTEQRGWWWRSDPTLYRTYDPATSRGWNGPYLKTEFSNHSISTYDQKDKRAEEFVVVATVDGGGDPVFDADGFVKTEYVRIASDPTDADAEVAAKRLSLLLSQYSYFKQTHDVDPSNPDNELRGWISHYQLDRSGRHGKTLYIRFVREPLLDESDPQAKFTNGGDNIVIELDTGLALE